MKARCTRSNYKHEPFEPGGVYDGYVDGAFGDFCVPGAEYVDSAVYPSIAGTSEMLPGGERGLRMFPGEYELLEEFESDK